MTVSHLISTYGQANGIQLIGYIIDIFINGIRLPIKIERIASEVPLFIDGKPNDEYVIDAVLDGMYLLVEGSRTIATHNAT